MSYLGYFNFGLYGRPISLADGLFILLLAPEFYLPLRELGAHYHARARALAAAEDIRGLLQGPLPGLSGGRGRLTSSEGIRLQCRDLHFAYDAGRRPALKGVSLELAPGRCIALVGGSGAGKSTLVCLLLGFITPDQGEILVNGAPLNDIAPAHWRRQVGWVGQNPVLFHGTLRENLRLGRPMRARIASRRRPGRPECWISHGGCRRAWIRRWASRESGFPAARPSRWRWRGSF
jgi:ATP-binding cassette subfamily C protein CydD